MFCLASPTRLLAVLSATFWSLSGVALAEAPGPQVEVVVRGRTAGDRLRRSPQAVEVVELDAEKRKSADLPEVLARSTSVTVQREGGLGSAGRYSLNGFSGDRVRFFLDGVPLELAGYPLGVSTVPVNLVDRIEVYQGVVPARFGTDALGGAVNLVTDESLRAGKAGVSFQTGSFNTRRLAFGTRQFYAPTGFFARTSGFIDASDNDYPIDVDIPDDDGRVTRARVRRFHDGYFGAGGTVAAGWVDRPWANRFYAHGFASTYKRDLQHNVAMTVPYGEVTYDKITAGGNLHYDKSLSAAMRLEAVAGYAYRETKFRDISRCRYDWYGRCAIVLPLAGEIDAVPTDRRMEEHGVFLRAGLIYRPHDDHTLRWTLSSTLARRFGRDAAIAEGSYDPLRAERQQRGAIAAFEHESRWLDERLSNVAFVKGYVQSTGSRERLPTGDARDGGATLGQGGGGDSLRVSLLRELYLKGSFEYATRLPTTDESFGDGALIVENLGLSPETSSNFNAGVFLDDLRTRVGALRASVTGFARWAKDLLVLLPSGTYYQYDNVLEARVLGLTGVLGYSVPEDWFGVDGRVHYQDVRNTSKAGVYALFTGDRVPNLPYLQAGASAYVRAHRVMASSDLLELSWSLRYVHPFLRGWESAGSGAVKLSVPSQVLQSVALSHVVRGDPLSMSGTFEVQNLTDQRAFDIYGVERPGRAFYLKMTVDYK